MSKLEHIKTTPVIHANQITSRAYVGSYETTDGADYWEIVKITHPAGTYFVAGGACNAGLIGDLARLVDEGESVIKALQEFTADLDSLDYPSGELLRWRGSMVI